MAGNPSQPTDVKVSDLKAALSELQELASLVQEPPGGVFENVDGSIEPYLQGMQGNGARVAGERYEDGAKYVHTYMWKDVSSGIAALEGLLSKTIAKHTTTNDNAATAAQSTNTTQSGGGSGSGSNGGFSHA